MAWTVRYAVSVRKSVQKLDPQVRQRIRSFLESRLVSLEDPRQLGKPLTGNWTDLWRYRVGHYRIICELHDEELVVLVVRIGHRSTVYKKSP